jgi:hypothetical protein
MEVCVRLFSLCAVLRVQVAALQRADPLSKECYRLCKRDCETEDGASAQ